MDSVGLSCCACVLLCVSVCVCMCVCVCVCVCACAYMYVKWLFFSWELADSPGAEGGFNGREIITGELINTTHPAKKVTSRTHVTHTVHTFTHTHTHTGNFH